MAARKTTFVMLCAMFILPLASTFSQNIVHSSLQSLLPQVAGWSLREKPQTFLPATLFEYINGAAEAYLSYDFRELIVAQYQDKMSRRSLTIEIYDLGDDRNSFGIYSSERYPESQFIPVGNQGYLEEGTLNFIIGSKYVKLLCYDCGENSESVLKQFALDVATRVKERGTLPPLLEYFPREGLVANSEKFILRNVLGFSFLHDGYLASYQDAGLEFDLFIIAGNNEAEATEMIKQYLSAHKKNNKFFEEIPLGYHIKDPYAQNIYISRAGKIIFGVLRIKDGHEETGLKYMQALARQAGKSLS